MIKKRTDLKDLDFLKGQAILIDKPEGFTSFSMVHKVRKAVNVKKVGHAGTLDPFASGLLIICTGKMTKEIYKFQDEEKVYEGTMVLGKTTPSMDTETEITETKDISSITEEIIYERVKDFLGEIEQLPPMYSAVKYKGKALYKYARKGKEIKREPRKVNIYEFDILNINLPDVEFRVKCSKGTYIRVLANDFGNSLGVGAYLKKLRRTAIGPYEVKDALDIKEFVEKMKRINDENIL